MTLKEICGGGDEILIRQGREGEWEGDEKKRGREKERKVEINGGN